MTRRHRYRNVDELTPAQQRGWGGLLTVVGLFAAWMIRTHPEQLRAPAWVAYAACAAFVLTGSAIALRAWLSRRAYAWMMVAVVAVMTSIPAWVAWGDGARECRVNRVITQNSGTCRTAFGAATVLMVLIAVYAVGAAIRTPADAAPSRER